MPMRAARHMVSIGAVVILGIIAVGIFAYHATMPRHQVLIWPDSRNWPTGVVSAASRFASLPPSQRGDEGRTLWYFLCDTGRTESIRPIDIWFGRYNVIHRKDVERLLGKPSYEVPGMILYALEYGEGTGLSLLFRFQNGVLVRLSKGDYMDDQWPRGVSPLNRVKLGEGSPPATNELNR